MLQTVLMSAAFRIKVGVPMVVSPTMASVVIQHIASSIGRYIERNDLEVGDVSFVSPARGLIGDSIEILIPVLYFIVSDVRDVFDASTPLIASDVDCRRERSGVRISEFALSVLVLVPWEHTPASTTPRRSGQTGVPIATSEKPGTALLRCPLSAASSPCTLLLLRSSTPILPLHNPPPLTLPVCTLHTFSHSNIDDPLTPAPHAQLHPRRYAASTRPQPSHRVIRHRPMTTEDPELYPQFELRHRLDLDLDHPIVSYVIGP
ncbi:hypothetical protein E4T56_gene16219 [Termitomyces sp. T112]|nr:hypothetical protein E4T56_gene16219 [Termitomyces sp. T112]